MGRGTGRYNKDCERVRQEKKEKKGRYGGQTAIRLREKLTGEDRSKEMKADCLKIFQNHYNACYSDFAKRSLEKNHKSMYEGLGKIENNHKKFYDDIAKIDFANRSLKNNHKSMYEGFLRGEVDIDDVRRVFYSYID